MPKMKYFDSATSKWIELDAKNADTLGGKSASSIEQSAKFYTDSQLANFSPKIEAYKHVLVAEFDGQQGFNVADIFNPTTDTLIDVTQNGWGLSAEKYVIDDGNIYLLEGVSKGTQIAFTILKNVPLKEQQSQLIAGDLMAGYYGKTTGLITGDELFAKTGLTAGTTTVSGDITWLKFSHNYKTLFVADRILKNSISWDDIQAQNLVKGKVIEINGQQYLCRLMTGSNSNPTTGVGGEWDDLIVQFTPNVVDSNWKTGASWCQEINSLAIANRIHYGGDVAAMTNYLNSPSSSTSSFIAGTIGHRPVLEVL